MKVIFDTNVLISAILIEESVADLALTKATQFCEIISSEEIFSELVKKILLPKFDRYVSIEKRKRFLQTFEITASFYKTNQKIVVCRDPKDNIFLELAVEASANFIISGDTDLLILNPFQYTQIISPKDFLEIAKKL